MEMLTSLYLYSKYLKNNTELQIFEDFCENGKYKQKIKMFQHSLYCVKCQSEALFIWEKLF